MTDVAAVKATGKGGANALPSGTVTFLFTDIEGSTLMVHKLGPAYEPVLEEHRRRIREAVAAVGGVEVNTEGDSLFVAFASPSAAVAAAAAAQLNLASQTWSGGTGIPVRAYDDDGDGTNQTHLYREITIDGERCYQKFRSPDAIGIIVAGGGAGKFSAVIGSWAAGSRGSQRVTYPCP